MSNVNPKQCFQLIEENKDNADFVLLDVRTPQEYEQGHIEGCQLLNYQSPDFKEKVAQLDKNKTYLIYCKSGMRSSNAVKIMEGLGFKNLINMTGGYMGWCDSGLPQK